MLCCYTTYRSIPGKQEHRVQALFNHTEDFVMFPDEGTTSLCVWDARTAQRKNLLSLGNEITFTHTFDTTLQVLFILRPQWSCTLHRPRT